ncbi:MAG: hypothetical protein M0Q92_14320 [Methanoregula sp.]|jgi:hypothetical protein|nr:hypothetical protein [Methanoregula sp.]
MNFQDADGKPIPFLKGMIIYYTSDNPNLLRMRMPKDSPRSSNMVYFSSETRHDNKLLFSRDLTRGDLMSIATLIATCVGCEIAYLTWQIGGVGQTKVEGYEFI